MQIVLLSGGSGKRLWPLSNDVRSKQFIKIFVDEKGGRQSMVQRVFAQIKEAQPDANITIATNISQIDSIRNQLSDNVDVVVEPERRDTFPAIMLACAYLALEKGVVPDETVIVLPVDSFAELSFFGAMTMLDNIIRNNLSNIALVGIKPIIPTGKYGYIVPKEEIEENVYSVSQFVEKPTEKTAELLINKGAYWNGGVFAFKLEYAMKIVKETLSFDSFEGLRKQYSKLDKNSFDYKVVEKAERVAVLPYLGKWTDIGTWRTLTDEMTQSTIGTTTLEHTRNTFVVNELSIPIVALGTNDLIIAASPDGILVSDLVASSHLKPIVDKLDNSRPMYEERYWGEYTVLNQDSNCLVKKLSLFAGKSISYQTHRYRDEIWAVTCGDGELVVDGIAKRIAIGDVVKISRGQKHKITAVTDLQIIETQIGDVFVEEDIEKYDEVSI